MTCSGGAYRRTSRRFVRRLDFADMSKLVVVSCLMLYTFKADAYNVVKVCQNKHCCRRANNRDILQTMHNLIDTGDKEVVVEASGCLSQCDKGPNVELSIDGDKALLHEMVDAQTCTFQLGEASTSKPLLPAVPKILVAASKVMEQSQQFSANGQFEEAIRFLTSAIDKLEVSPAVSPSTPANAHAHALRAEARLQLARKRDGPASDQDNDVVAACIADAKRVVQDLSAAATPKSLSLAYRAWTDAELFLAEEQQRQEEETSKKRDITRVVAVLREWYQAQPMYRTKLQGEIQGLLLNAS
eukprot:CAMPEP_0116131280 /NCGR_PEP_ID=MMETSP0329-20121206/8923_1 /TAXON_ID=697910 /ORGANISM="Pseudo-nitzschia arenysensis, Strain B593" /LENGTH=299 /DNA_ID=CAMNT_0003625703 /DNA_START=116 /DNA_END=1015 /DNA_ORIENTATION=-